MFIEFNYPFPFELWTLLGLSGEHKDPEASASTALDDTREPRDGHASFLHV